MQVVIRGDPLLWGSFHSLAVSDTEELAELFWLALAWLTDFQVPNISLLPELLQGPGH